ncbi:MAG: hypothetical protein JO275_09480 [Verrucomicrobia bacterium]|nr:hypothetical protein [Verrucomicrobiota bacterium]
MPPKEGSVKGPGVRRIGVWGSEFGEGANRQPIAVLYRPITDTPIRDIPTRRQVDTPIRLHARSSRLGLASVTGFPYIRLKEDPERKYSSQAGPYRQNEYI